MADNKLISAAVSSVIEAVELLLVNDACNARSTCNALEEVEEVEVSDEVS